MRNITIQYTYAYNSQLLEPEQLLLFYGERVVQVSCIASSIYVGLRVFMRILNLWDVVGGLITPVHSLMLS